MWLVSHLDFFRWCKNNFSFLWIFMPSPLFANKSSHGTTQRCCRVAAPQKLSHMTGRLRSENEIIQKNFTNTFSRWDMWNFKQFLTRHHVNIFQNFHETFFLWFSFYPIWKSQMTSIKCFDSKEISFGTFEDFSLIKKYLERVLRWEIQSFEKSLSGA